jgi:putative oxidoreductase
MTTNDRSEQALIVLRVTISLLIAIHGWHRMLYGFVDDLGDGVTQIGFPAGLALAWLITLAEAFGALAYARGLFVLPLTAFYVFVYTVSILFYHSRHGWYSSGGGANGCEYPVLLVSAFLCVGYLALPERKTMGEINP